jgi:hypothetical protein
VNSAAKKAASAAASSKKAAPPITFNVEQFRHDSQAAAVEAATGEGGFQPDPYDGHLNHQELTKMLLDLSAFYRDAQRLGVRRQRAAECSIRVCGTATQHFGAPLPSLPSCACLCFASTAQTHCACRRWPARTRLSSCPTTSS